MEKWKASNNVFGSKVYRVESSEMDVAAFDLIQAEQLAADLNELEAYREERRWRKIGEEWPEDGKLCQLAIGSDVYVHYYFLSEKYPEATHWRPTPTDTPKEEKQ